MVALISFVVVALAGTTLARPGYRFPDPEVRGTGGHHHQPPPMTTGNPPTTTPEPTTPNPPGPGTQTITTTRTDTITRTTFVPHSTAVATVPGHTWYSTWLEASTYTTTTCYPVTETPSPQEPTSTQPPQPCDGDDCEGGGHGSEYICPPQATVTVTVTECRGDGCEQPTVTPPPAGPTHCPECQTYTITDIHEGTSTIVVPPQTLLPPPGQCGKCQTITITDIHEGTKTITIPPETSISTVTPPPTSNPPPIVTGTGGPKPSGPGTTYTLPTLTSQQPTGTGSPQRRWWL